MISGAWRQNLKVWVPAATFLALMIVSLLTFVVEFADEVEVARSRLERRTEELETIRAQRLAAEKVVDRVNANEAGLADFYGHRLSSESQSLTRVIAEIKDLCGRAGILPAALSYERQVLEGQDLFRRIITFSVDGTYAQIRQLINFIELSDTFLILDQIALRGNDVEGAPLRISLRLSTLFAANSANIASESSEVSEDPEAEATQGLES